MSRRPHLLSLLAILIIGMFPLGALGGGRNTPAYDGQLDFGAQLLQSNGDCLFVDGNVTSGAFFQDLRRLDLGDRFEYRKHGKIVTQYPDSLTTSIRVVGNQCGPVSGNAPSSIFKRDSYTLTFEVEWKDGLNLSPAVLSTGVAHCTGFNSVTVPDRGFSIPTVTCKLTVNAKGVPLDDHLIVSVYAPSGEQITRLSAAP
jgi:hypothetical protein